MNTDNIVLQKSNLFAIELTEFKVSNTFSVEQTTKKKTFDSCLESTTATWWIHLIVSISLFNEEGLKGEKRVEKLLKLKIWVNDSSHFSSKSHIIIMRVLDISVCLSLSRFNLTFLEASQSVWLTMYLFYLTSVYFLFVFLCLTFCLGVRTSFLCLFHLSVFLWNVKNEKNKLSSILKMSQLTRISKLRSRFGKLILLQICTEQEEEVPRHFLSYN